MKLSIITINYNNAVGLEHTIQSVISQSFCDYEFIVIDGGSTDGSVDILVEHNSIINYWVSEKDNGIYHAMNKGVAQAHGDYCIFVNSGDTFFNNFVLEQIAMIGFDEDIVVGKLISDNDGKELFLPPSRDISMYYLYSATVPHQSSFIKTKLLRQYPYDEKLKIVSDWKFFVETIILANCTIKYIDIIVAVFDTSGVSTSNPNIMWKEKEQVLSELFPPRILADYQQMKDSECLTLTLTPQLRLHYGIDKILYRFGRQLIMCVNRWSNSSFIFSKFHRISDAIM